MSMTTDGFRTKDHVGLGLGLTLGADMIRAMGRFRAWLYNADGKLIDYRVTENLVTNVGLQYLMDSGYAGSIYVGLLANTPTIAAATIITGITGTDVPFSEATRPIWTKTRTAQTMSNSASKARFSFTGAGTNGLGGAFLETVSTKTDFTTGVLVAGKAFTGGNLGAVANGYTLDIQYDITAS